MRDASQWDNALINLFAKPRPSYSRSRGQVIREAEAKDFELVAQFGGVLADT